MKTQGLILKTLLFFGLFGFALYGLSAKNSAAEKNKKPPPSSQRQLQTNTKEHDFLFGDWTFKQTKMDKSSKEAFLDEDFSSLVSSSVIREDIHRNIKKIAGLCGSSQPLKAKALQLEQAFSGLRKTAQEYLQKKIDIDDQILLRDIHYHFQQERLSTLGPVTEELLNGSDLRISFGVNYRMYYNLPETAELKDFPDQWAQDVYKGLDCLYADL